MANVHLTSRLNLSLGGRYTADEKDYSIDARVFSNGVLVPPSSFADIYSDSWDTFTPRAALEYEPNDDILVYGTYSTGYKAGGYNSRGTVRENVGPYDPETVDAFELGLKSDLFDRSVQLNLAAFLNKYSDLQSSVTKQGAVRAENVTVNVASAETYGIEADLLTKPARNLTLGLSAGWLKAEYTDFCEDIDGVFTDGTAEPGQCAPATEIIANGAPTGTFRVPIDNAGLPLSNSPEWSASIRADYEVPLSFGYISLHADARYTSRYNTWGRAVDDAFYRDEVVLVNANVAIAEHEDGWRLSIYGRNLTNQDVLSGATKAGANPILQFYLPPREWGAELGFKF
nr:TonB-dependent receptor [Pacificimonas flava]